MKPDFSYVFKHISSASKVLLAVEPGKIMKNPVYFSNLIYPADAINLRKSFAEAVNTGTPLNFEARFMVKNEIRWFLFNAHPEIQPDKSITWDGILMDITEKKQAEEAASNERNLMKILMDNLPDVIYFKNLESRFLRVNKAFLKNQDVESETEILNKTDFDMFKPEHAIEAGMMNWKLLKPADQSLIKLKKMLINQGKQPGCLQQKCR